MAKIIAVCTSKAKGARKEDLGEGYIWKIMVLKATPTPVRDGAGK